MEAKILIPKPGVEILNDDESVTLVSKEEGDEIFQKERYSCRTSMR